MKLSECVHLPCTKNRFWRFFKKTDPALPPPGHPGFRDRILCPLVLYYHLMSSPAFVVIDDSNPDIQYNGPWKQINTNQSQFVNVTKISGPPFQNSLHGVNETSNFTFPFNGMLRLLTFLFSSPLTLWSLFRIGNQSLRDIHKTQWQWDSRSKRDLGVFYRRLFEPRCPYLSSCCATIKSKQLGPLFRSIWRWKPHTHCNRNSSRWWIRKFFLCRPDSVYAIFRRSTK